MDLTAEIVTRLLQERLDPSAVCTKLQRGPVGNGQETWLISGRTGNGEVDLVLRRSAPGGPLAWTDRRLEFEMMSRVARAGLPIPHVHWIEEDGSSLGRPYFVMDRSPGTTGTLATGDDRERIAADLGRNLAYLHGVSEGPQPAAQTAAGATAAEIQRWRQVYDKSQRGSSPQLAALLAWLDANRPESNRPVVMLWGDPGPHNVLAVDGSITALLDWELAHPGDPLEDLGTALWFYGASLDAEVMIDAYAEAAASSLPGLVIDRKAIDFYIAMACVTRSVMVLAGAGSFAAGATLDPSAAALGIDLLLENVSRAASLAGWQSVAPPPEVDTLEIAAVLHPTSNEILQGLARFLREEVLAKVDDPRTRRSLKVASALLLLTADRERREQTLSSIQVDRNSAFLAGLEKATGRTFDNLEAAARACEEDPELAAHRQPMRDLLMTDLAEKQTLTRALQDLYRQSISPGEEKKRSD